jgi:AcrR family transcriptional regulator
MRSPKAKQKGTGKKKKQLLEAAQNLFAAHGFSRTSISMIAAEAGISPSLIYQYVDSKEALWEETKKYIRQEISEGAFQSDSLFKTESMEEFLLNFIKFRMVDPRQKPNLLRILKWQMLEESRGSLIELHDTGFSNWWCLIQKFQDKGEIYSGVDSLVVLILLLNLTAVDGFFQRVERGGALPLSDPYVLNIMKLLKEVLKDPYFFNIVNS